jgi:hypothetical protein
VRSSELLRDLRHVCCSRVSREPTRLAWGELSDLDQPADSVGEGFPNWAGLERELAPGLRASHRAAQFMTQIPSASHGSRVLTRRCATSAARPNAARDHAGKVAKRIRRPVRSASVRMQVGHGDVVAGNHVRPPIQTVRHHEVYGSLTLIAPPSSARLVGSACSRARPRPRTRRGDSAHLFLSRPNSRSTAARATGHGRDADRLAREQPMQPVARDPDRGGLALAVG